MHKNQRNVHKNNQTSNLNGSQEIDVFMSPEHCFLLWALVSVLKEYLPVRNAVKNDSAEGASVGNTLAWGEMGHLVLVQFSVKSKKKTTYINMVNKDVYFHKKRISLKFTTKYTRNLNKRKQNILIC